MSPFTPFLTETMYQNMRRVLGPDAPQSIHFLDIPAVVPTQSGDAQIQASVHRMQKVIDLGRVIRERHQRPTKTPLRCLTVAHDDAAFISDLSGAPPMIVGSRSATWLASDQKDVVGWPSDAWDLLGWLATLVSGRIVHLNICKFRRTTTGVPTSSPQISALSLQSLT